MCACVCVSVCVSCVLCVPACIQVCESQLCICVYAFVRYVRGERACLFAYVGACV